MALRSLFACLIITMKRVLIPIYLPTIRVKTKRWLDMNIYRVRAYCSYVLPTWLRNKREGKGGIVVEICRNIASFLAL